MSAAATTTGAKAASTMLLIAATAIPISLLWDYSWESAVGVDRIGAAPHVATYTAVIIAALSALILIIRDARNAIGAWIAQWGAVAFVTAFLFDQWWQAGYGMSAGIWHPAQLLKAVAYFAIVCGAWWTSPSRGGGAVLAMIATVTLASNFANLQHGAAFYQIACAAYPLVLAAIAVSGKGRFPATRAALVCMALHCLAVWILPLVPGSPEAGPIYHPRTTLLPPPFPPLLVAPAFTIDWLMRSRCGEWSAAGEAGLAFFVIFTAVQWPFATFLLSPSADQWFFAGGGRHWPFFMPLTDEMRTGFWPGKPFDLQNSAVALALSLASARLGLWLGAWIRTSRK